MAAARISVLLLAVFCVSLPAQQLQYGHVTVAVTDATGAVVPGVRSLQSCRSPLK
ncbi:MAG: hypothetical protein ACLQG3_06435 [Terracidiphilus sp.]